MRRTTLASLLTLCLPLLVHAESPASQPATATQPAAPAAEAKAGTREVQKFGKPLAGVAPISLASVLEKPEAGKMVRLEGSIEKVCQNKGCWLELKQGDQGVHVTFEGYSFFVPKDSTGRKVVIEGRVKVEEPDPETVKHLQGEGAGESAARKVSVEATGVEIETVAVAR